MSIATLLAQIDAHFLTQVLWFALLAVPISVAAMAGVFSPRRVIGPPRMLPGERIAPLWVCMLVGLFVWMMVPATYSAARGSSGASASSRPASAETTQPTLAPGFSDVENIVISAVTGVAVLASMMFANAALRREGLRRLGFSAASLVRSAGPAIVSILIVIPFMYVVSGITQWFWDLIRLEHQSHPFLEIFGSDTNPMLRRLIVISAIVLAPAFEELLFRGHLQTAVFYSLRQLLSEEHPATTAAEPMIPNSAVEPAVALPAAPPRSTAIDVTARWIAIVFTSFIFALVHPQLWMMPPIFILSLCLGYAYERTGNLWVPILIHASFNAVNVALFWLRL
jgi:membrane protease YdiL (CAAX protease family)